MLNTENYVGRKKKGYFEGWYFRHGGELPFSLIVGVSRAEGDAHSFVQYIDTQRSYYFRFGIEEFSYCKEGMEVRVGGNIFSLRGLRVDISQACGEIKAVLEYSGVTRFKKSVYAPTVMGPFSYLPMVCNHCVVSMTHDVRGSLTVAGSSHAIACKGYIEKDFGSAFPDNYFWTHASTDDTSIMFAVAWPLIFGIKGYLCLVSHRGKQYNFSYYTRSKLQKLEITDSHAEITLASGNHALNLIIDSNESQQKLIAPARGGKMDITINENLTATISATLILNAHPIPLNLTTACFESVLK